MTDEPRIVNGIVVSGHAQVTDSALAAGHCASAHRTTNAPPYTDTVHALITELRQRLEALEPSSEAGTLEPGRREQALDEADAVLADLTGDQPVDGRRLVRRLTRLRSFVAGAASLLGLVASAEESVRAIIG